MFSSCLSWGVCFINVIVLFSCYFFSTFPLGQIKAAAVVAAEAENETDTEIGTGTGTGNDGTVLALAPDRGLAPGTGTATETETEIAVKGETALPAGLTAHLVPERTRTETTTDGRTNTSTAPRQRSLLLATSITEKSPA